ncbi:hypothetical protein BKA70DRAFT_1253225, partial [Coprinopsis sp. MPI-PUGE-AT-0042]
MLKGEIQRKSQSIRARFGQLSVFLLELYPRLKKIPVEIKSLRKRLEALVNEEEEISELLQQCNNELAPIRQLSDDLLREIFVRCLPSQVTFDSTEAPCFFA